MTTTFPITKPTGYACTQIPSSSTESSTFHASHVRLDQVAIVAEAESIVEENWIRSHYELVPKGTIAKLARDYKARLASRPYKKTSDIDLPMIDDEEDW